MSQGGEEKGKQMLPIVENIIDGYKYIKGQLADTEP